MQFQDRLQGDRIILVRTIPGEQIAEELFELIDANRRYLEPWLMWVSMTKKVSDTAQYLKMKEQEFQNGTKIEYGIYKNSILIGSIALVDIDNNNLSAEIGYWLSKDFSGQGYVSESVKVLEEYAFKTLKLNRLQIKCDSLNIASSRVAKNNQYIWEGTLKKDVFNKFDNTFRDTLIYSKLSSEYTK